MHFSAPIISGHNLYEVSQYIKLPTLVPITLESIRAACLLPLWDGSQPVISLVERWQQIHPVNPVTLEPINGQMAFKQVKDLLETLDAFLYVLLERSGSN